MSSKVIPDAAATMGGPPTILDLGANPIPIPFSVPGDVADGSGDLWLDAFGDRLVHGELVITPEQAQAAAQHGWETVPGNEPDGKVRVRRADPHPEQD